MPTIEQKAEKELGGFLPGILESGEMVQTLVDARSTKGRGRTTALLVLAPVAGIVAGLLGVVILAVLVLGVSRLFLGPVEGLMWLVLTDRRLLVVRRPRWRKPPELFQAAPRPTTRA